MSVWSNIQNRSCGIQKRQEDLPELESINDTLSQKVTFMGNVDPTNPLPQTHGKGGDIYYVNEDVFENGKSYLKGDMVIDTGNGWKVISSNNYIEDYIGQDYYIGQ